MTFPCWATACGVATLARKHVRISVIISNFNGARFLPRLLETLSRQTLAPHEILLVDRESTDGSVEVLAAWPAVRRLNHPAAAGLVSGYAVGAEQAVGEALFFANEDLWLEEGCLEALASWIRPDAGIVCADPWQWTYDGRSWVHGAVRFERCAWDLASPDPRYRQRFTCDGAAGDAIPFPSAGAFLMDRGAYRQVGGWDRSFFLDFEDVDLGIRLWQRGLRSVTVPGARVFHAVNAANVQCLPGSGEPVSRRRYIGARSNRAVVAWKHFSAGRIPLAVSQGPLEFLNNLRRGRWRQAYWDVLADADVGRRLREVWRYRSENRAIRGIRPGEAFFAAPEFAVAAPARR